MIVAQPVKKFSDLCLTLSVIMVFTKACQWILSWTEMNAVCTLFLQDPY
jgi:hypothetical protein